METLTSLRAEVAMRTEDHRIATKHRIEAAERISSERNDRAYKAALRWETDRAEAEREVRARLIAALAA